MSGHALRLVLFDIDGTLVTGGPAKRAFHRALLEVYGTAGPIEDWEFSGKTDPQIARELLREGGLTDETIDRGLPTLWRTYLAEMERRMPDDPLRVLPGVEALVDALSDGRSVALGLLTGNVSGGARLKLAAVGLYERFPVGAFGSDHEVRNELPAIAVRRASTHWERPFRSDEVVVVGDTPRDVACGRHHGARTVAVATGRFTTGELARTGADEVLQDLNDTERVVSILQR